MLLKRSLMAILILAGCCPFALAATAEYFAAVAEGDTEAITIELDANPLFVNDLNERGAPALHMAAARSDTAMVELLLEHGASALQRSIRGRSPLHSACYAGSMEIVERLLEHGADIEARDNYGNTCLHYSIYGGHEEISLYLVEREPFLDVEGANCGWTPLLAAIRSGSVPLVESLINHGADVHRSTFPERWSGLHEAARSGNLEIVRLLVDSGVDLAAETTPWGQQAIEFAVGENHLEVLRFLIDAGADVHAVNEEGTTLLHTACWQGRAECARMLIDAGLEVDIVDNDGSTPLQISILNGGAALIEMLLSSGADIQKTSGDNEESILYRAARFGNGEAVNTLIAHGAKVNAKADDGATPLYGAVIDGSVDIIRMLIDAGAKTDIRLSETKQTPLHIAAAKGLYEIAELLVDNRAKVNRKNSRGEKPLELAARYGHRDIATLLRDSGARTDNLTENYGKSPLLTQTLGGNEAHIWYLGHSGWAIKTRNHLLIVDYWKENDPPRHPGLANGFISVDEIGDLPVTVFATHEHADHYYPPIFDWVGSVEDISYVIGCQPDSVPEYTYAAPRQHYTVDGIEITTIASIDAGVGFLFEVDDLVIYHSGDHCQGEEPPEPEFVSEIEFLAGLNKEIDIAFMPATSCAAGGSACPTLGNFFSIETLQPKVLFPMHAGDNEEMYREFAVQAAVHDFDTTIHCADYCGDNFHYLNGSIR
ncbi:MAG: hypothetical protein GY835_26570 [bacterium]|nr:hypothetical protein [bacterium]